MDNRARLHVVVREGVAVLKLLAREDQALLVGLDAILVLDLCLNVIDRERWLDFEGDRLAGECLDKDLHGAAQSEDQMKRRLRLDVVVREGVAVLELLASEDQALVFGRDALFVLDLGLNVVDRV